MKIAKRADGGNNDIFPTWRLIHGTLIIADFANPRRRSVLRPVITEADFDQVIGLQGGLQRAANSAAISPASMRS
jgi:hypothetical protein